MDFRWIDVSTMQQEMYYLHTNSKIEINATVFKNDEGYWGFAVFDRTFLSSSKQTTKHKTMVNCEKLIRSELKCLLDELSQKNEDDCHEKQSDVPSNKHLPEWFDSMFEGILGKDYLKRARTEK